MIKPIEPGCLAVTIGMAKPESNGIVVTVVRSVGVQPLLMSDGAVTHERCWKVSKPILKRVGVYQMVMAESKLLRIDDYDASEDVEEAEELTA